MNLDEVWDELASELPRIYGSYRGRITSLDVSVKPDQTLLSEADLAVQEYVVSVLAEADNDAGVIAEESGLDHLPPGALPERIWIVDPIDGTREFLSPTGDEFCTVVCLVEDRYPVGLFVLAPELGLDRRPLCVRLAGPKEPVVASIDGAATFMPTRNDAARHASVTRESTALERPWEVEVARRYATKTRTTSQTLDLVRTSIDISGVTMNQLPSFAFFYRERQKLWDGAAGLCLASAMGLCVVDRHGAPLLPFSSSKLGEQEPTLASSLVAASTTVRWMRPLLSG